MDPETAAEIVILEKRNLSNEVLNRLRSRVVFEHFLRQLPGIPKSLWLGAIAKHHRRGRRLSPPNIGGEPYRKPQIYASELNQVLQDALNYFEELFEVWQ